MKRRLLYPTSALGLLVLASLGAGACSSKSSTPTGAATVTLAQGVTSLTASQADDVSVSAGQLSFPAATHPDITALQAGAVIVGEAGISAGTKNPWGFLRKVVSVADDGNGNTVVTTQQATLLDLLDDGEFQGTLAVPADASASATTASVKTLHPKGGPITLVNFDGKVLLDQALTATISGKSVGFNAKVTLTKGSLQFTPTYDVGAKIKPALTLDIKKLISEAHAVATGSLDATVEVDAALKLVNPGALTGADIAAFIANELTKSTSSTLIDKDIALPSLNIGPLSMPAHAHFSATVDCDFKWGGETEVVVGATGNVTVTAGAKWDGSTVSPVWDHSQSLNQTGPTWTITDDMMLKCSVTPTFSLSLWDVAAGEVTASAYATLAAQAQCNSSALTGDVAGQAFAGASASAKASLDVFGLYKWQKECTLFDWQSPVASFTGSIPLGKGASCTPAPALTPPTPVTAPGPSCFGDGTTPSGDDSGVGDDSSILPGTDGGGASDASDGGTLADGAPIKCGHDACTIGDVLTEGCTQDFEGGACIKAVCQNDPYCCTFGWTASCVNHLVTGDIAGCTPYACP